MTRGPQPHPVRRRFPSALALAAVAIAAIGCRSFDTEPETERSDPTTAAPTHWKSQRDAIVARPVPRTMLQIGRSVEGRPIECELLGVGPDVVLILATIHGNEAAGTPLTRELADRLGDSPEWLEARRVAIVHVVNPDGMAKGRRHNAHGVDLNRNFPAGNWNGSTARHGEGPLSEPESRAIHDLIGSLQPVRVISIHQPLGCVDHDGPATAALALAQAMAEATHLPVRRLGTRPGSLGAYVGEVLGVPIITLELPGGASRLDAARLWELYGSSLLAGIRPPEPGPDAP